MRRRFLGVFVLFAFLASAPFLFSQPKFLTILHTNDTHSCLFPFGPQDSLGGIARMSTLIKQLKAKDTNVLTLHGGDVFVGTFEFNKYLAYPELNIMQGLHDPTRPLYDAMALGNHEFDLGAGALAGVLSGDLLGKPPLTLPFLCANLDPALTPADLYALVKPNLILDVGEPGETIKVGIFGLVNRNPLNYTQEVLAFLTDPIAEADTQVSILEAAGCEVIICLSHLGLMTDADVAAGLAGVDGIDIIVGGHSHDALEDALEVNGKIIVQGGYFGLSLGELEVKVEEDGIKLSRYELHQVNKKIRKDPGLLWTLNRLRVGLVQDPRFGPVLTKNVAKADWDMEKSFPEDQPTFRDTAVGNLVSDALMWGLGKAGFEVDAALEVLGYIGSKIYKGKIVGNDVMRVVPYGYDETSGLGFKIVIVELTGFELWSALEYAVQFAAPDGYDTAIQPSGLSFQYNSANLYPNRVLWAMVNGTYVDPFDPLTKYKVAINEQVYRVLTSVGLSVPKTDTGLFEYNLVRDYMKKLVHVRYGPEGRVIDAPLTP